VRDGYIKRAYDPNDRRIVRVKLIARGSDLVEKINEQRRQMVIKIFGKISENDRNDYLRILMQIKNILTKGDTG
jgi:5'-methylthioadenosine phosphorylase